MSAKTKVISMDDHRRDGPQLEDGYVRVANELFDAVLAFPFSLKQQRVVLAVIRKTYGYGKKTDDMSASQIGTLCGMSRNHVTETLNELASMGVITKRQGEYGSIVGINKRHREWASKPAVGGKDSPKTGLVPNRDGGSPEMGLEVVPNRDRSIVPNRDTQKTTFQKTTSKDNLNKARSSDRAASPKEAGDAFATFWTAFAYKRGRTRAEEAFKREYAKQPDAERDAWLQSVLVAAAKEAERRPHLIAKGLTPMYAQGWISQARYEDEDLMQWGRFTPEQQTFIDTFNENIGDLCPAVEEWTEKLAARVDVALQGKWSLQKWAEFWRWVVSECEFSWPVSLDWLLDRDNFSNVRGGKYHREAQQV